MNRPSIEQQIPPETLRRYLRYEPEIGLLFWNAREPSDFVEGKYGASANCAKWNTRWAGKPALTSNNGLGYKIGAVKRRMCRAHRAAWAIHFCEWPRGEIDHINGDRSDNRISNLRVVDHQSNASNMVLSKANKSGFTGVYRSENGQKWIATISSRGKYRCLGTYAKLEDAANARRQAQSELGFHHLHGQKTAAHNY